MRVAELFEIDTAGAAETAVTAVQREIQTRRTEAQRALDRASRAFLAAYRGTGQPATNMARATQQLQTAEMDSTKMAVVTALFQVMAAAVPQIQRENRAGDQSTAGVNAQLGEIIRTFVADNTFAGAFNAEAGVLLAALSQE